MIPNYLADLQLPSVFSPYTSFVENFLLLSNKDEYIVGFIISVVVMFAFTIYEKKYAYEVKPYDQTILDEISRRYR